MAVITGTLSARDEVSAVLVVAAGEYFRAHVTGPSCTVEISYDNVEWYGIQQDVRTDKEYSSSAFGGNFARLLLCPRRDRLQMTLCFSL